MVNATHRPIYPQERPGTHCIGGWVGPRAGLDRCGKSRLPPGFDLRTVQSVASRYTDCAIPAPHPRGTGGKCGRGVGLTTHLHPVSRLTIRSNTSIPARVFMVCRPISCRYCFTFKKWNESRTDATQLTCHFRLGN